MEAYCSYEISKLLKEKGFNEKCVAYYPQCITPIKLTFGGRVNYNASNKFKMLPPISAPTLQMAMRWLREVHKVNIEIHYNRFGENYKYLIIYKPEVLDDIHSLGVYFHYEEAVEAALEDVLKHLI